MADNRTGLSATDLAEQFRDVCGDGSMEWVTGPMQAWLLLDAADMLDENDKLRGLCEWLLQVLQEYVAENAKLREEFDKMDVWHSKELLAAIDENKKLRELVRVMAYCMQQGRDCDGCAVNGADGAVMAPSGCDTLRDRMRELGVVE